MNLGVGATVDSKIKWHKPGRLHGLISNWVDKDARNPRSPIQGQLNSTTIPEASGVPQVTTQGQ